MQPRNATAPRAYQDTARQDEDDERQMEDNDRIGQHAIEHVGSRYADIATDQRLCERRVRARLPRVLTGIFAGAAWTGGGSAL